MKNKKSIRLKIMGKAAVIPAVFIITMATAVLAGCQNAEQEEISSEDVSAELQIQTDLHVNFRMICGA